MSKRFVVSLEDNAGPSSRLCLHFGQARYFAIIKKENDNVVVEDVVENPKTIRTSPRRIHIAAEC